MTLKHDFIAFKQNIINSDWKYKLCKSTTGLLFITFIIMLYKAQVDEPKGFSIFLIVYFSLIVLFQYLKSALFFYIFMYIMLIILFILLLTPERPSYESNLDHEVFHYDWILCGIVGAIVSPFLMIYYHYSDFRDTFLEKSTTILILLLSIIIYLFKTFILED